MTEGLVHIYTGDGKGKTTAAMGLVLRSLAYNRQIFIMQFLKGRETGEKKVLEQIENVSFKRANRSKKFTVGMSEEEIEELKQEINRSWVEVEEVVKGENFQLVVLDEIMVALDLNLVSKSQVIDIIENKNKETELVLTGRGAPEELMNRADYVTEMKKLKHPFENNIKARQGIEF